MSEFAEYMLYWLGAGIVSVLTMRFIGGKTVPMDNSELCTVIVLWPVSWGYFLFGMLKHIITGSAK